MQIYIFGDLSFATFMLRGVSMLYSADGTFIQAALILSLLFLLWSFIKWSLNPEKTTYPVREWAFGLIFFLILGGTSLSPKFRVTLIHANHGATPATFVDDVPLLAAAPSWLATNFFRFITQRIETAGPFIMPGYEKFRGVGMSKPDADPLNALVKLNTLANTAILDRYFEIQVKDYIKQCFLPHIAFDPAFPALEFTKRNITQPEIWDDLLVSNVHLTITTTGQDGASVTQSCIAFHANFKNSLTSDVPGTFRSSAAKAAASRNISEQEVRAGAQIIFENLTGSPGNPNPVDIMQNMFLIRSIKDSINTLPEAASLQTWANKMVFEAERKRTFEAAGERSLFMKLYIPTITTIETFSLFIAPVLMMLSVLGGYGFSLIGKYLMLVLFINLWSFIKVFVDIFTALSLATAFKQIGPVPDGSDINKFLGFETYAQTISEIESLLTVASNLTMAIPFFAMFLLYGGIHSVMGVMRTVTGGSVDGSNMAPTMATSMNGAAFQTGDSDYRQVVSTGAFSQSQNLGTNQLFGSTSSSSSQTAGYAASSQVLNSQINTETRGFNEIATQAFTSASKATNTRTSGNTETAASTRGVSWMDQTADTFSGSYSNSQSQSAQILSRLAATLGGKISAGASLGSKSDPEKTANMQAVTTDPTKESMKKSLISMGLSADMAGQLVAGMTEDDVKTFAQQVNTARQNATAFMKSENYSDADMYSDLNSYMQEVTKSDAYQKANSKAQTISTLRNTQAALGAVAASDSGNTDINQVNWSTLPSNFSTFQRVYSNLNDSQKERISQILDVPSDVGSVAAALSNNNPTLMQNGAYLSKKLIEQLNKHDDNPLTVAQDSRINSAIYSTLASTINSPWSNGFAIAAKSEADRANAIEGISNTFNSESMKTDTSKVQSGPIVRPTEGFDSDGNPVSKVNRGQAQNAIGSEVPSTVAGASNVVPIPTPEQLKEMQQNQYRDLSTVRSGGMAMNDVYGGFLNSVGDFMSLFKSRDLIWGKDAPEIASNLTRYATQELGNKSMALEQGIVSLSQISNFADISKLFDRLNNGDAKQRYEAATQISQMNDAFTFLNTKEGMSLITQSFSPEDGARLLENARQFDSAMRFNTSGPLNKDTFDALSSARITGAITDNNADMYIKAATSYGVNFTRGSNTDQTYEDGNALRYMLFDAPNSSRDANINQLRDSVVNNRTFAKNIEGMSAGYNPDSLYTRQAAAFNIARDEDKLIAANGGYNGLNDYQQGVNLENRDGVIQSSTMNYVMQQLVSTSPDQSTEINAQSMERAFKGSDSDRQRIFGVVSTQGPLRIAERYADLGFNLESTKLTYSYSHLDDYAVRTNLAIPKEKLDSLNQNVDERIGQLPSFSDKLKPN